MKQTTMTELIEQHHDRETELLLQISELEVYKTMLNQLLVAARTYVAAKRNGHMPTYRAWVNFVETVQTMQHIDTESGK